MIQGLGRWALGLGLGMIVAGVGGEPAQAQSSECQRIRHIRQIAILMGRDSPDLARWEYIYCRQPRVQRPPQISEECLNLTTVLRLAEMQGESSLIRTVAGEQQVTCALATPRQRSFWRYPNGQLVQQGSIWYYPNGQMAKFGSTWNYPNGQAAQFGSNWTYPNGQMATFGDRWYGLDRQPTDLQSLLSLACSRVNGDTCQTALTAIATQPEPLASVTALSLIWRTAY